MVEQRRARRALAAVFALAVSALTGCRGGGADDAGASTTTAETTTTVASIDTALPQTATGANGNPRDERIGPPASGRPSDGSLNEGQCFTESLVPQGELLVHAVQVLDCAQPHDGEVYAVVTLDAGPAEPFPGETAMARDASSRCLSRFEPFVGLEYATSQLRIAVLRPTATTWVRPDRTVVCSLYDEALHPLTRSMRASGR